MSEQLEQLLAALAPHNNRTCDTSQYTHHNADYAYNIRTQRTHAHLPSMYPATTCDGSAFDGVLDVLGVVVWARGRVQRRDHSHTHPRTHTRTTRTHLLSADSRQRRQRRRRRGDACDNRLRVRVRVKCTRMHVRTAHTCTCVAVRHA
jgi:hypothetical protein